MRRVILIAGSILGVIVLIVAAVLGYAVLNLNSIIQSNRERILTKVSDALGRPVAVSAIKASLGWGVALDLEGLTVADDPAFSSQPLVSARDVFCRVELMPLLAKQIKVVRLDIQSPEIRMIRNRTGQLNVATIGKKSGAPHTAPAQPRPQAPQGSPMQSAPPAGSQAGSAALTQFSIKSFSISDGTILYQDPASGPKPIAIRKLDLDVENLRMDAPFDLKLALAAVGDQQNLKVAGTVGPLVSQGGIDVQALPLALAITVGPITTAELKSVGPLAKAIPEKLTIDGPISATAKISGTVGAPAFDLKANLGSNRVVYAGALDKAPGVALVIAAAGSRSNGKLVVSNANLTLAELHLTATNLVIESGRIAARLDSNRFYLEALAKTVTALQKEKISGQAELHANVAIVRSKPSVDGTLTLVNVALSPGGKMPGLSGVNGDLKMKGNSADIGPLNFVMGTAHAQLTAHVRSLQPLAASYDFSAGQMKTADLVPSRPPDEVLNDLKLTGTAAGTPSEPTVSANLTSASGNLNNIAYQNLNLSVQYGGKRADVKSLTLGAFGGTIAAAAQAELAATPRFNVSAHLTNVDLQQALASQKSKAAAIIRGILTGNVKVTGAGSNFDQIKPTLAGGGKLAVRNGKLIGVNVVASALKKIDNVPGIGALLPMSAIANHPELFKNPDTDIDQADLTFVLQGPRITTHDLTVKAVDYSMLGDGWFDMDKRIDMAAHILLSPQFSSELKADKQNIVYLENKNAQVDIPLRISGELPKPRIAPDVGELAQRAGSQAVKQKGQQLLGKFLGKKGGLGGLLGGGSSGGAATGGAQPQATPAPSNPLSTFKKLF
jgi:uncharacterized protein involved in outer membrane biogenesis